ncbi:dihydroorotate dehydrogenase [Nocardia seriolae]|nr:dihydroorotate dehydrogenase [Nocardia seriolae]
MTTAMRLAIHAEYGGWELSRVRAYTDGSRRVLLRRRKSPLLSPTPEAVM